MFVCEVRVRYWAKVKIKTIIFHFNYQPSHPCDYSLVVQEEDVVAEAATLSATVQQRQDAYAAELERSNALEEKCKVG